MPEITVTATVQLSLGVRMAAEVEKPVLVVDTTIAERISAEMTGPVSILEV